MTQRSTAVVKWFNNKSGYGFLTYVGDGQTSEDVFVHHSEIQVVKDQYKYLVQGEYVEFLLSHDAGEHKCLAKSISGVNGGKLMCETRNDTRTDRLPREYTTSYSGATRGGATRGGATRGGATPRLTDDSQGEWMLVKRTPSHTGRGRGQGLEH